jgi:uncharacterized membrane protein
MPKGLKQEKGAGEYAGEAVKHWARAARYGFAALAAKREGLSGLTENLPGFAEKSAGNGSLATAELPIQESIDIAIPVAAAYALCLEFEEFPEFLDRVESVEREGDKGVRVTAKVGGHVRELEIEVMDERPDERLDWECGEGYEHSGVISLHPLAPRLTRMELTVERQPESLPERFARRVGLTQRVIQEELRRFKAYAELWEEADDYGSADVEAPEDEDYEDEELEEDEGVEEEPVEEPAQAGG